MNGSERTRITTNKWIRVKQNKTNKQQQQQNAFGERMESSKFALSEEIKVDDF